MHSSFESPFDPIFPQTPILESKTFKNVLLVLSPFLPLAVLYGLHLSLAIFFPPFPTLSVRS